jgi:hypothetical protein
MDAGLGPTKEDSSIGWMDQLLSGTMVASSGGLLESVTVSMVRRSNMQLA